MASGTHYLSPAWTALTAATAAWHNLNLTADRNYASRFGLFAIYNCSESLIKAWTLATEEEKRSSKMISLTKKILTGKSEGEYNTGERIGLGEMMQMMNSQFPESELQQEGEYNDDWRKEVVGEVYKALRTFIQNQITL